MKQTTRQKFPPGWNEKKIRAVIAHYDRQTDEEGAAEIATASEASGETWICVPTELVGAVTRLIEGYSAAARGGNHRKKARTSSVSRHGQAAAEGTQ